MVRPVKDSASTFAGRLNSLSGVALGRRQVQVGLELMPAAGAGTGRGGGGGDGIEYRRTPAQSDNSSHVRGRAGGEWKK